MNYRAPQINCCNPDFHNGYKHVNKNRALSFLKGSALVPEPNGLRICNTPNSKQTRSLWHADVFCHFPRQLLFLVADWLIHKMRLGTAANPPLAFLSIMHKHVKVEHSTQTMCQCLDLKESKINSFHPSKSLREQMGEIRQTEGSVNLEWLRQTHTCSLKSVWIWVWVSISPRALKQCVCGRRALWQCVGHRVCQREIRRPRLRSCIYIPHNPSPWFKWNHTKNR